MKKFSDFKKEFIQRCKKQNACEEEFKRVLDSKNKYQLLRVIMDNIDWSYKKVIFIEDFLTVWTNKQLEKCNAYVNNNSTLSDKTTYYLFNSSPTIENWGNSSPTIVNRGNSSPTIENWGNSSPTIVNRENSSPTIVNWGNSNITFFNYNRKKQELIPTENVCINDIFNKTIYIKKDKFSIVYLD